MDFHTARFRDTGKNDGCGAESSLRNRPFKAGKRPMMTKRRMTSFLLNKGTAPKYSIVVPHPGVPARAGGRNARGGILGAAYAGFACAGLESPSQKPNYA